jgi:chromosomal replication initiation ATPase DnaA
MMCKCLVLLLYLMLSLYPCSAQDTAEIAEIQQELANAHGGKEADLRSRMARALVLQAKDEYKQDRVEQAEKSLDRARSECERATAVAIASRSKETRVEIRLRQISRQLNEIARSVPFDNRVYIEQVRHSVEELRTRLLDHMFKKK